MSKVVNFKYFLIEIKNAKNISNNNFKNIKSVLETIRYSEEKIKISELIIFKKTEDDYFIYGSTDEAKYYIRDSKLNEINSLLKNITELEISIERIDNKDKFYQSILDSQMKGEELLILEELDIPKLKNYQNIAL